METKTNYNDQPVPIADKIKTLSPICEGRLYAHEVLILFYAHKYTTGSNLYEGFWQYKYGISDMDAQLNSLLTRGFLRTGSLEETIAHTATVPVLKNIAHQNGLKVSGKKNDIIQQIITAIDVNKLNNLFPDKPYFLTESGQHVIKKENYMKYIHNWSDSNINIWNFSEMAHEFLSLSYTEILQQYYSQQSEKHLNQKQYGQYRTDRFFMAKSAMEENNFDMSLVWLFEIIYYDLSGLSNFFDGTYPLKNVPQLFPYECSSARIAKGILSKADHCRKALNISESELKEKMINVLSGIKLPFQIFTPEECVDIFLSELHQDKTNLEKIYTLAENRYKTDHLSKKDIDNKEQTYREQIRDILKAESNKADNIFDPEFEKMLNSRIEKLDDISKKAFQRVRDNMESDDVLSIKDRLLLTIEAMERSQQYHEKASTTEEA